MNKIIIILMVMIFSGCSQKKDILITKNVYPNISRNAIFDAAKTLFTLSNKENKNRDFIIDAYRDKLEVDKIMFKNNIIHIDVILDKWILELYQIESETRANLIILRKNTLNEDDVEGVDQSAHKLFWDRLDYLLGLKKDWKACTEYFLPDSNTEFCNNYFITLSPKNEDLQKNILISQENITKNTIDTVKADIYERTDLSLNKSNNDIFKQSENIQDMNILVPVIVEDIFETKAEKKLKIENNTNLNKSKDSKSDKVLDEDDQMIKFKENLKNIINMTPENQNTNSNNIILNSNNLKENSEFKIE